MESRYDNDVRAFRKESALVLTYNQSTLHSHTMMGFFSLSMHSAVQILSLSLSIKTFNHNMKLFLKLSRHSSLRKEYTIKWLDLDFPQNSIFILVKKNLEISMDQSVRFMAAFVCLYFEIHYSTICVNLNTKIFPCHWLSHMKIFSWICISYNVSWDQNIYKIKPKNHTI